MTSFPLSRLGLAAAASGLLASVTPAQVAPTPARPTVQSQERTDVLGQDIALHLIRATVEQALDTIAARVRVRVIYSPDDVPLDSHVSLVAEHITVGAALSELLRGTGLSVSVSPRGWLLLERARLFAQPSNDARLVGTVTDSATHHPVAQANVHVDGTTRGAVADADGRYTINGLAPGSYTVTARRVGYTPLSRAVVLTPDAVQTTLDFALSARPMKLDEVVTTAVGDQRRYQIGNDIGSINVDSLAPTTPVTTLTDVLSARIPGVEVMASAGEVGNGPAIRIRGQSSLVLQGDPIIVVDGMRVDNSPGMALYPGYGVAVPAPSRLNDIDFTDVASIDVLKGPSAATEYGTDAANGVIVIKTKHGQAGPPRWTLSAEQGFTEVGSAFPNSYYAFGHTTGPNPTPVQCPLNASPFFGTLSSAMGTCAVDSIVAFQPLNHARTTLFGIGNREKADLAVSGGSDAIKYYLAAGLVNEVGSLQLPPALRGVADSVGLPTGDRRPNTDNSRSARANTVFHVAPTADIQVNAAYLTQTMQAPGEGAVASAFQSLPLDSANNNYGYGPYLTETPLYQLEERTNQNTNRLTGSITANWSPTSWFQGHATVGVDHGSQTSSAEYEPQLLTLSPNAQTQLDITNGTTDIYSVDVRGTLTARVAQPVRAVTAGGLQIIDTRTQSTLAQSGSITTENETLNGATAPVVAQTGLRQATLGGYIEEQLALWERLFLTGAIRADAGSNFGTAYHAAVYPKASVSYLPWIGGATSVRFRGAFGQSGIQPPNGAALQLYAPQAASSPTGAIASQGIINVVNPNLQPERSTEFEGGADLGFWHDRLSFALTAYGKRTDNALVATGVGWSAGGFNAYENVGEVTNSGFEGSVSATLIDTRNTSLDLTVDASTNHNELVRFARGINAQTLAGTYAVQRFALGVPLYSYAAEREHWTDVNHDGIVERSEISVEDSLSYAGTSQPTRMASASTHLSFWRHLITIGTQFDYRGGYRLLNTTLLGMAANYQTDLASNDRHAPIWQQMRDAAMLNVYATGADNNAPPEGFYEDASFVRFRELSLTVALPDRLARVARFHALSLTAAVRNLALWTPYTGGDPEVSGTTYGNTQFQPTTNSYIVNRDLREGDAAVPLSRYFILRLNASF